MRRFFKKKKRHDGFTLAELLVTMSIFIIILTVAVGIFANVLRGQRTLTQLVSVNNNAGLVLEQMAREMRTGYSFSGAPDACANSITFVNAQDTDPTGATEAQTTYALVAGAIERTETGAADATKNGNTTLTASNVEVKNLCFRTIQYAGGGSRKECNPQRIMIAMQVDGSGTGAGVPDTYLSTTVASRILPIEIKSDPMSCRLR